MQDVKEYYDLIIYPQEEQVKQIENCLNLSKNVVREMEKVCDEKDPSIILVEKSREILKRFENRSQHHLTKLAFNTIVGTLAHYRTCKKRKFVDKINQTSGFSPEFVADNGLCCLFTKDQGEALLVNNLLLLPSLGTILAANRSQHCFNKISFMFIYRCDNNYRARMYSSWPFEKPQKQDEPWIGINFGKHKLLFLSDGRSYSFYHLLSDRKKKCLQSFKEFDILMYYFEIVQAILRPGINGVVMVQSQLLGAVEQTRSINEKKLFLLILLNNLAKKNIKLRVITGEVKENDDFMKAQAIRHATRSFEISNIHKLISYLQRGKLGQIDDLTLNRILNA